MENEVNKPNFLGSEINAFKSDKIISEQQLSKEQNKYAQNLLNGVGEAIIKDLNTPMPEEIQVLPEKEGLFKRFIKKLEKVF